MKSMTGSEGQPKVSDMLRILCVLSIVAFALFAAPLAVYAQTDPLPSWSESVAKRAIINFIERTTTKGSADFVPLELRIATFDNDGTLWCEQPSIPRWLSPSIASRR